MYNYDIYMYITMFIATYLTIEIDRYSMYVNKGVCVCIYRYVCVCPLKRRSIPNQERQTKQDCIRIC